LFGPAWEAHLFAVAVDLDPDRPWHREGRTRFVYSWPMVSTGHFEVLRAAHRLGARQQRGVDWSASAADRARVRFDRYLSLRRLSRRLSPQRSFLPRPALAVRRAAPAGSAARRAAPGAGNERSAAAGEPGLRRAPAGELNERRAALTWARRVKIAWLDRLGFSALELAPAALGAAAKTRAGWELLATRALGFDARSLAVLRRIEHALVAAARHKGLLFDARRYRRFHAKHLQATLGPGWKYGPVTEDQLRAIIAYLEGRPDRQSRRWLARARLELARLSFVVHGHDHPTPDLRQAMRRYGEARLKRVRRRYRSLKSEIEKARKVLTSRAKGSFDEQVRRRLHGILEAGEDPLLAGSFYFQTEHLLETSSGFTHVGLIKRLRDPRSGRPLLWMFDRVLGFHYAYPVVKLTNSVPVQIVVPSRRRRGPRRYRWLRVRVPDRFQLGRGQTSGQVTLLNLLTHVKQRLRRCRRLWISSGLYYAGITWIINHPRNRLTLADLWEAQTHTGYGYRTLDPAKRQRLKGRILYIPVRERPSVPWGRGCPPRLPASAARRDCSPRLPAALARAGE
jgi:hypothetical protein